MSVEFVRVVVPGIYIQEFVRDGGLEPPAADYPELLRWLDAHSNERISYLALQMVIDKRTELVERARFDWYDLED